MIAHAAADNQSAFIAQRRQRPPDGEMRLDRSLMLQRHLQDWHIRPRIDQHEGNEHAVVETALTFRHMRCRPASSSWAYTALPSSGAPGAG